GVGGCRGAIPGTRPDRQIENLRYGSSTVPLVSFAYIRVYSRIFAVRFPFLRHSARVCGQKWLFLCAFAPLLFIRSDFGLRLVPTSFNSFNPSSAQVVG